MRQGLAALGAALGVLLGASGAAAQATDAINACVSASGKVRIVDPGTACKRRERALNWAAAGPQGPQGPPGEPGPTGGGSPACGTVARLTIPPIAGDGPGGTLLIYRYTTGLEFVPDPAGGGRVDYDQFCVTKPLDKASPQLFQSALSGTPHASAKLEVLAADGVTVGTVYDLTTVIVSSVKYGAPTDCQLPIPLETACLAYVGLAVRAGP
jgi:hypothetical protein